MDVQQKAVAEEFDKYEDNYAAAIDDAIGIPGVKVDFFTRVKTEYFVDLLNKHLGDASKQDILDIGCGVGLYHKDLLPQVNKLSGADISKACVAKAEEANEGVNYTTYDGSRLPYEDNTFDAVVTICVMHHVPPDSWENFSVEMHRVLKQGGIAVVFEHNPYNPMTMRIVNRCPFDEDAVLLKPAKTVKLLQNAGFRDVYSRSIINVPPSNSILKTLDKFFSRLPLGAQYYSLGKKDR